MPTPEQIKNLETVPEVVPDSLPTKGVLRVAELRLFMVEYVDADQPGPRVRAVALSPTTNQAFFLDDKIVGREPQKWFLDELLKKLG